MKKIKQEIFESMQNENFGESMSDETKLNVLTWVLGKLHKGDSQAITALKNEVEELREKMTVEHCPSLPECYKASQELTRLRELLGTTSGGLSNLVFTADKLWDEVKPIKDSDAITVTHPIIEEAKQLLTEINQTLKP